MPVEEQLIAKGDVDFGGSELKCEIVGEARQIAFDLFVQAFGGHAVDASKVHVQQDRLSAHPLDRGGDVERGLKGFGRLHNPMREPLVSQRGQHWRGQLAS